MPARNHRYRRTLRFEELEQRRVFASYTDSFAAPHDYSQGNVAGTIWDGVLNAGQLTSGDADLFLPGSLTLHAVKDASWQNTNTAPTLYKNVTGDFDVSVLVKDETLLLPGVASPNSDGGLIVLAPNANPNDPENYVGLRHFLFEKTSVLDTTNSVTTSQEFQTPNDNEPSVYLRIIREGDLFEFFQKDPSGGDWTLISEVERPDLKDVKTLQVGLFAQNVDLQQFQEINYSNFQDFQITKLSAIRDGFSGGELDPGDDSNSVAAPLPFRLNFFGDAKSSLWINNNGNITFDRALSQYVPFGVSKDLGIPLIAPFFSDVDTTQTGSGIVTYGVGMVDGHQAFAVNWLGVGYHGGPSDKIDNFQLVLVDRADRGTSVLGDDFDVEFNYDGIAWETGDISVNGGFGNASAAAGFSDGSGRQNSYFEIPGSEVSGSLLDDNLKTGLIHDSFNSDDLGRYVYHFVDGFADNIPRPPLLARDPPAAPVTSSPTNVNLSVGAYFPSIIKTTPGVMIVLAVMGGVPDDSGQGAAEFSGAKPESYRDLFRDWISRTSGGNSSRTDDVIDERLVRFREDDPLGFLLEAPPDEHEEVTLSVARGIIEGHVWRDADGDEIRDRLELPVVGQKIFLDLNGNGLFDVGEPLSETNLEGVFHFADLADGDYQVCVAGVLGNIGSLRASGPRSVRISQQDRHCDDVEFAVAPAIEAAPPPPREPAQVAKTGWALWAAGLGATAVCGGLLLLRRRRQKHEVNDRFWNSSVVSVESNADAASHTSSPLFDTARATGAPNVSKIAE